MSKYSPPITFINNNSELPFNKNVINIIEYKYSSISDDKIWSTSYNNKKDINGVNESFNQLYKEGDDYIYETVGNSVNKNPWLIKEFLNTVQKKTYKLDYNKNSFNDLLLNNIKSYDIIDKRKRTKSENNLLDFKLNLKNDI
tara:strand:+ start:55 stop:480 length:426 start_codon:yes stop_codon:yes gene_type:complete